jgi:hypothetical protein
VSFEELRIAREEKDASILVLRQAAEAACAELEKEKKKVEGKSPPPPEPFVYRSPFFS